MSDDTTTITIRLTRWDPVTQVQWDDFCHESGLELGEDGWFLGGGLRAGCERDTATFCGPEAARTAVAFWLRFGGRMSVPPGLDAEIDGILADRPCMMSPEKIRLTSFGWGHKLQAWVTWTADDVIPLRALAGRTVNIGTKDGMVYEGATVTGFDALAGVLVIEGGMCGRPRFEPGEAESLDGPDKVRADDIARGYIHPASTS